MLDILSSKLLLVLGDLSGEVTSPGAPAYSQSNYTLTEEKDKYSWLCLLSQKSVTSVKSLVLSREPEINHLGWILIFIYVFTRFTKMTLSQI